MFEVDCFPLLKYRHFSLFVLGYNLYYVHFIQSKRIVEEWSRRGEGSAWNATGELVNVGVERHLTCWIIKCHGVVLELFLILLKMVETPNFVFKWGKKEPKLKLVSFRMFKKQFSKFIILWLAPRCIGRDGGGLTRRRVCCAGRAVMVVESRSGRHHHQRLPCDAVDYHRVEYHPPVHS